MIQDFYQRCFIGIPIPTDFLPVYTDTQNYLKNQIKYISLEKKERAHITLYYLGNMIPEFINEVDQLIRPIIRRYIPSELTFSEIKCFADKTPRTLYFEIKNSDWLYRLNYELAETLKTYNFQERDFKPHMTIARLRRKEAKEAYLQNRRKISEFATNYRFTFDINEIQIRGTDPNNNELKIFHGY